MNTSDAIAPRAHQRLRLMRAAAAMLLACALLCAQSLGLWHRLVHPGPTSQLASQHVVHGAESDTAAAHSLFSDLFSTHQGDPDCQSFDHACLGDAMGTAGTAWIALALLPLVAATGNGLLNARWHALFQARGPPFVR